MTLSQKAKVKILNLHFLLHNYSSLYDLNRLILSILLCIVVQENIASQYSKQIKKYAEKIHNFYVTSDVKIETLI